MADKVPYRERLINAVTEAGRYITDHAEEIVGDLPLRTRLAITWSFSGTGYESPILTIEHNLLSREVIEALHPQPRGRLTKEA